ncbi:general odorant-binding protein 71 [Leptidea sinapis]|uniref:general odorant-binding protein 71 n=1 Tax=Leptidea sinapis TaxID=189913 RepID=UPI0021C26EF5|nr:general odorant-binding protein 71 [Leptidea sinapis]
MSDSGRQWLDGKLENINRNDYGFENGMQRREQKTNGRNQYSQYESSYNQRDTNDRRYDEMSNGNRAKTYGNAFDNNYGSENQNYNQNDDFGSSMTYSTQNSRRYKRDRRVEINSGQRSQYNPNIQRSGDKSRDRRNSTDNNQNGRSCAMHCFLENLKMTGENGMPDKYMMTNTMTKDVRNEDLREFLQESIEECFQILDNENSDDRCEFSKNLLICLSEKGRANCDDWKDDIQFL